MAYQCPKRKNLHIGVDDEGGDQRPEDSEDYNFGPFNAIQADELNCLKLQNWRTIFFQPEENDAANTIMQHDICPNIDVLSGFGNDGLCNSIRILEGLRFLF